MARKRSGGQGGDTTPGRRRRPLRAVLIGLVVLAVVAVGLFWLRDQKLLTPEGCRVKTAAGEGTLEVPQAANAATIAAVAHARGLPDRAVTISLATAMQESKIRNLTGGDRDSVGLFQQRPSQGWGTAQQISDPVYATNKFLDGLVKVPGYTRLPLTDAAQQVQKSGYPQAYAKHETKATLLASALTGREAASLNCVVHDFAEPDPDDTASAAASASAVPAAAASATPAGRPDRAQVLSDRVRREFGRTVSPATGYSSSIKGAESAVSLTPDPAASTDAGPDAERENGWAVAHWAVAQAQQLGIETVAYDGKIWRKAKSEDGWKPQPTGTSTKLVLVSLAGPAKA
ncbi:MULTISPECIES: hypothetical protein [Streptomycetaceae]|uniref:hypothetical protein n=1 Tax=Streptomycetaceae TaxID=2062 RepID=UPI000CDC5727|nr:MULTISPECIES: hypothetical protein [Streptomycetaceae]AUY49959.1 hypothetical protein C2142_14680 [Streptomyces sp. CB01881]MBP0449472.1 hypothetical protein [Kitasatospora sp. RG8]TYC73356.1 hypothetical protein EH183_14665 [Streptomyces sp. CB01881]